MGLKEFQIISKLGEGAFSSVWKVKRISDGQEYAMKKVKMSALSEKEKQNALNEVRILASINNPNIIGYKEVFLEDNSMTLCIVMEYAGGGDLQGKIGHHQRARTSFKEQDIWSYAIQMISGLKYLHDTKIIHRDLKSANVFVSSDGKTTKLGDLNVSIVAKTPLVRTQTGTPYYASPEVWQDKPYNAKSDIWSLGCVLYELCTLRPPFRANDMAELSRKVQKGVYDRIPSHYSGDLSELIAMCLKVQPSMRPTSEKLLSHPIVMKRATESNLHLNNVEDSFELLGTIELPRNIKALNGKLPKPNYQKEEVKSEEFEKGSLSKIREIEKREKRPHSHCSRKEEKPEVQKVVEKNRIVSGPSRRIESVDDRVQAAKRLAEVEKNGRHPLYVVKHGKAEPVEMYYGQRRPEAPSMDRDESRRRAIRQNIENIDPSMYEKRPEKIISRQQYLLNKYNNVKEQDSRVVGQDRAYGGRNDILHKRADDIVRKYYADAIMAEKKEEDQRRPGRDVSNILERYNNAYNLKDVSRNPSNRKILGALYQQDDYSMNRGYANPTVNQGVNYVRQMAEQGRGVLRPSWWG